MRAGLKLVFLICRNRDGTKQNHLISDEEEEAVFPAGVALGNSAKTPSEFDCMEPGRHGASRAQRWPWEYERP